MDVFENLKQIDFWAVLWSIIAVLVVWNFLSSLFEKTFGKLGLETKKMRQKREDHELLIKVSENLVALQERHKEDEEAFRNDLTNYMKESREDRKLLHEEMSRFTDNRIHDRKQSLEIQRELTDSIKELTNGQEDRDKQIEALMCGSRELLGDTIDQRYNKYISLNGIPQNEVDEFDDIYAAYKGLKGNHGRETKYKYVKEHLQVIPVETKLLIDMK